MTRIEIGVLSDTHGMLRPEVLQQLQTCSHILHAGDIVKDFDLDELALYGKLYAVRGNNDTASCFSHLQGILRFEIGGVHFLMTHCRFDVPRNLDGVDVVIYGHSHRYSQEEIDGRLWLNPGSCGRSRFGGAVTMAKIILTDGRMTVKRIDLENG